MIKNYFRLHHYVAGMVKLISVPLPGAEKKTACPFNAMALACIFLSPFDEVTFAVSKPAPSSDIESSTLPDCSLRSIFTLAALEYLAALLMASLKIRKKSRRC